MKDQRRTKRRSGPYGFTYFKRFHRKGKTTLTITSPSPESLTGREAHERVEQILRETMDLNLWKAVEVQQGTAVSQARFNGVESLAAALDKAAGSEPVGAEEASLLARAEQEFLKYFTQSGGEGKEQKNATAQWKAFAQSRGVRETSCAGDRHGTFGGYRERLSSLKIWSQNAERGEESKR
jgi:hypothetical protein